MRAEGTAQSERLQEQMRAYIAARFELVRRIDAVAGALAAAEADSNAAAKITTEGVEGAGTGELDKAEQAGPQDQADSADPVDPPAAGAAQESIATREPEAHDKAEKHDEAVPEEGEAGASHEADADHADKDHTDVMEVADVDRALGDVPVLSAEAEAGSSEGNANGVIAGEEGTGQAVTGEQTEAEVCTRETGPGTIRAEAMEQEQEQEPRLRPSRFLPEIGRLAREIVRNCEEKVAVAQGAYNSVGLNRHLPPSPAYLLLDGSAAVLMDRLTATSERSILIYPHKKPPSSSASGQTPFHPQAQTQRPQGAKRGSVRPWGQVMQTERCCRSGSAVPLLGMMPVEGERRAGGERRACQSQRRQRRGLNKWPVWRVWMCMVHWVSIYLMRTRECHCPYMPRLQR